MKKMFNPIEIMEEDVADTENLPDLSGHMQMAWGICVNFLLTL